jgi:hypothetical protein
MTKHFAAALAAAAALAMCAAAAQAATISIVSMYYSKAHPVPHLRYDGDTVAGDVAQFQTMIANFVHCRTECATDSGRSNAVVTLNGPGGNYHEGLALADFFRANNIATVVEAGAGCYSACAFAFLGGTGYSSNARIGNYVERMIEPGGVVGFHAPYRNEDSLRAALEERSPSELMAESRDALSLMVKELVKWNVDPEIIHYMLNMGPDQLYEVLGADDFYLVRAALPPIGTAAWISDIPTAVRNACIRLLAQYERGDPLDLRDRIDTPFEDGIGHNKVFGSLSGYRLSDRALDVGHCSATDESIATGTNLQVSLYLNPGLDGSSEPILSFFNRDDYFSTAGIGGSPLRRVFQRGGMAHWFLPVGIRLDALETNTGMLIQANRFSSLAPPDVGPLANGLIEDVVRPGGRIAHSGAVWVFEQTGGTALYDATYADSGNGVTLTEDSVSAAGFFRDGTHADGTRFSVVGLTDGSTATVLRTLVLNGGAELTQEEADLLRRVQCGAALGEVKLAC